MRKATRKLQNLDKVTDHIRGSVATLIESPTFEHWRDEHKPAAGSLVGINNSFVYRDQLKTTKSPHFVCIQAEENGAVSSAHVAVSSAIQFLTDFKLFHSKSGNFPPVEALDEAVRRELQDFGKLVFVLAGQVQDNVRVSHAIGYALFDQVIVDPGQADLVRLDGKAIIVRDTFDEEALWAELGKKAAGARIIAGRLPDDLRESFADSLEALGSEAYAVLKLPDEGKRAAGSTLLDAMVDELKQHAAEYGNSLKKCHGNQQEDPVEFNNILRIAYNFSSDATKVIRLLVSICDLKPLLFWCTVAEWFQLSDCFKNLPWTKSKKKPSLAGYQETISGARNRAFHNIFPFNKALEAQLDGISLEAIKLRMFSVHKAKKSQNIFDFKDKALVEILTEFTRAGGRFVPTLFWQRNLDVMAATVALLSAINNSLELLAPHIWSSRH